MILRMVNPIEHITHSICTLEFENHNELYQWFVNNIDSIPSKPQQYELAGAVTSKRKLSRLVNEGKVLGWDDPRLLTICGLRRRGVTPKGFLSKILPEKRALEGGFQSISPQNISRS